MQMIRRAVVAVLFALPCAAQTTIKPPNAAKEQPVDMTTPILDRNHVQLKDVFQIDAKGDCSKCDDLTVGQAAMEAVMQKPTGDIRSASEIWAESQFAASVKNDKEAALTGHQRDVLTAAIIRIYPLIPQQQYGMDVLTQAIPVIDPNKKPEPI